MKKIYIIVFGLLINFQLSGQIKFSFDSTHLNSFLQEIELLKKTIINEENERIKNNINGKKKYTFYVDDNETFKTLILIPIYNVQLRIDGEKKSTKLNYYLEIIKYKPINRILIFNDKQMYIGTLFYFKEISFLLFDYKGFSQMCYQCRNIDERPSKKFLSFFKKQLIKNKSIPIYFIVNNFSNQIFYLNKTDQLFVLSKKQKNINADIHFSKKYNEKDFFSKSCDTILKYTSHECLLLSDTTSAIYVR